MSKLPSLIALVAVSAFLAGCTATPTQEPLAAEPSTTATTSVRVTARPSATPSVTPSAIATPTPVTSAEPTMNAGPTEIPAEVTPVPTDATVPEPAVEAPVAIAATSTWEDAPRITAAHGSSFTVTSTGYQPGQNTRMYMGIYQTDSTDVDEQTSVADATGSVSYTVNVTPDIAPNTYGLVTSLDFDGQVSGEDLEASKRFALIDITAE